MSETLDATEFKRLIASGSFEKIEGRTVAGEVSFRGEEIASGLRLLHVTFLGPVDFSDAQIKGTLDLTGCWFVRTLRLSNANIAGSLVLDDVIVESAARNYGRYVRGGEYDWNVVGSPLAADSLVVEGAVRGAFLAVVGHADFSGTRVAADFSLSGFEVHGNLGAAGVHVGGNLVLSAARRSDTITKGYVANDLTATNLTVTGNVFISGMHFGRDCDLWSATVEGNLWLTCFVTGEEQIESVPTVVRGHAHLGASKVRGHLQIESAQVDGVLKLYSSETGPLRISTHTSGGVHDHSFTGCRIGALHAQGLIVRGDANIYCLEVTGLGAGVQRSVSLANARIDGGLRLWSLGQFTVDEHPDPDSGSPPEERGCNVVGDVDLTGAFIGGPCDLTNLHADGTVLLEDAEIRGDVVFSSAVSLLESLTVRERFGPVRARLLARTRDADAAPLPMASIRRLAMATMTCHNDVDLSGLTLRASETEIEAQSGYGSIEGRNIKVAGHLWQFRAVREETWAREKGDAGRPPSADSFVPGSADYSGAKVFHMSLSGASFQTAVEGDEDAVKVVRRRGLLLAGAEISELTIEPLPGNSGAVFPVPISLADLTVKIWDVAENDSNRFDLYRTLLASDPMFRRSTYLAVERSIRNRGHEDDADRIYREMVRRSYRERRHLGGSGGGSLLQRFRSVLPTPAELLIVVPPVLIGAVFLQAPLLLTLAAIAIAAALSRPVVLILRWLIWDWLLGFGTAPLRIGVFILFFFVLSVVGVYLDARNIGPSLDAQIAHPDMVEAPAEWGALDAISIGLRTHVPVVTWAVRDEWQLADEPDRKLHFFSQVIPGRPEDFGLIMIVLNFLAWPPFLAFALRRAFRSTS